MTTPMMETVRTIPLVVEKDAPQDADVSVRSISTSRFIRRLSGAQPVQTV
jgi:hypothetical protein